MKGKSMSSDANRSHPYVDPDVAVALAGADPAAPDFWEMSPADARAAMDAMADAMLPAIDLAEVRDLQLASDGLSIDARLYRPDPVSPGPLLVFFHGGGWEIGSVANFDTLIRRLAHDSGVSVLSVEYRLAPEHPFPAGLDDCVAAVRWVEANADSIGFDRSFLAVGGDSSGGNLAAAVAQVLRDEGGPTIDHQLLIYPVVNRRFDTESYEQFGTGHFLTRATMQSFWQLYIGHDGSPAYADLHAAGELAGLPPATVFTCGLDVLRDEGDGYAADLAAAGIAVTHIRVAGLLHGIWCMDASGERAYQFGLDIAAALARAVARSPRTVDSLSSPTAVPA